MLNVRVPEEDLQLRPRITVIGVGGAGGNAVNNMIRSNLEGVEFMVCNTDAQALTGSEAETKIQLGTNITRGLGAGSRPDVGRAAAEEAFEDMLPHLEGANMVFITAGMGGGTGTGAAPVIARLAREQGILTVGVVTKPFHFEGAHRMRLAESGIAELQQFVDTLLIIPNQNLFRIANEKTTFADAFKMADDVLHSGVRGVTDLMVMPGLINLDFADIRTVMSEMGKAMMGTGEAEGDRRSVEAAEAAISNPLLDDVSMKGARGVLINITGGMDMTLFEVDEAANRIRDEVDSEANIIFGSTFDQSMDGTMRVSVVATGIDMVEEAPRPKTLTVVSSQGNDQRGVPSYEAPATASGMVAHPIQANGDGTRRFTTPITQPMRTPIAGAPVAGATVGATARKIDPSPVTDQRAAPQAYEQVSHDEQPSQAVSQPVTSPEAPPVPPHAERSEDAFVAPRPVTPAPRPRTAEAPARAEPFAEAAMANGARTGEEQRRPSLFERVTGMGGRRNDSVPKETRPRAPQQKPVPSRPGRVPPGIEPPHATQQPLAMDRPSQPALTKSEEEMLDIPAFLRRQAN